MPFPDPESTEPTYTLTEARKVLALEKCSRWGHTDLTEMHSGESGIAVLIWCEACGTKYVKAD